MPRPRSVDRNRSGHGVSDPSHATDRLYRYAGPDTEPDAADLARNARRRLGLRLAARLWEGTGPEDQVTDLFMVTIRRAGAGRPEYRLSAISPGEDQPRHGLWDGTDRDQLAGVLAGLLAPDITRPADLVAAGQPGKQREESRDA
jgi:hypothetical protein